MREKESGPGRLALSSWTYIGLIFLLNALAWRRDLGPAMQAVEDVRARALDQGVDRYFDSFVPTCAGWCRAREGDIAQGIRMLKEGSRFTEAFDAPDLREAARFLSGS